jgi:tetratricopeptide (TPR) repeat protein
MTPVQEVKAPNRRLDSWKEIAAFFGRDERTVKRWEKERALPIHRLPGGSRARVFAFTAELERWMHSVEVSPADESSVTDAVADPASNAIADKPDSVEQLDASQAAEPPRSSSAKIWGVAAAVLLIASAAVFFVMFRHWASAQAATPAHVASPEAQELYLQGRYYWNRRTPQDLNKAVDAFTQAIVHDPNYAPAYVGLADCYNLLREFASMPNEEAFPRALAAATKAVELDDSSAEAHASLAFVELYWNWDVQGAEREFRRAIKLNPNYAAAHHWYANFLTLAGRDPEALEEISRAEQIDPGSSAIVADRALVLYNLDRVEEAITMLKGIEGSQPTFYSPHRYLSYIYLSQHDIPHYLAESTEAAQLSHDATQLEVARVAEQGYHGGGEHGMFESMLKTQEKLYRHGQGSPFLVAVSYYRLNQREQALQYLQTAYQQHDPYFLGIRVDRTFQPLHDDPTFRALERKSGLPPLT